MESPQGSLKNFILKKKIRYNMCKIVSFLKKSGRIHKKLLMVEMSIIEISICGKKILIHFKLVCAV